MALLEKENHLKPLYSLLKQKKLSKPHKASGLHYL
jgi:hypothetical protein